MAVRKPRQPKGFDPETYDWSRPVTAKLLSEVLGVTQESVSHYIEVGMPVRKYQGRIAVHVTIGVFFVLGLRFLKHNSIPRDGLHPIEIIFAGGLARLEFHEYWPWVGRIIPLLEQWTDLNTSHAQAYAGMALGALKPYRIMKDEKPLPNRKINPDITDDENI